MKRSSTCLNAGRNGRTFGTCRSEPSRNSHETCKRHFPAKSNRLAPEMEKIEFRRTKGSNGRNMIRIDNSARPNCCGKPIKNHQRRGISFPHFLKVIRGTLQPECCGSDLCSWSGWHPDRSG